MEKAEAERSTAEMSEAERIAAEEIEAERISGEKYKVEGIAGELSESERLGLRSMISAGEESTKSLERSLASQRETSTFLLEEVRQLSQSIEEQLLSSQNEIEKVQDGIRKNAKNCSARA